MVSGTRLPWDIHAVLWLPNTMTFNLFLKLKATVIHTATASPHTHNSIQKLINSNMQVGLLQGHAKAPPASLLVQLGLQKQRLSKDPPSSCPGGCSKLSTDFPICHKPTCPLEEWSFQRHTPPHQPIPIPTQRVERHWHQARRHGPRKQSNLEPKLM